MTLETKNYGAHSFGQPCPDIELQLRAIASAKTHPLYQEANAFPYCEPSVLFEPKSLVEKTRLSEKAKKKVTQSLADVERVVVVSFFTSDKQPEPLSGAGKTYDFFLHPESMAILHFDTGTWRS